MARKIYTDEQISDALAVFAVTGSYREAAASVGCSITTVKKWAAQHEVVDSDDEKSVEDRIREKVADLRELQEEARETLMRRIISLAPREDDLRAVATAYGIVTDKAQLSRGLPTTITENLTPGDARRELGRTRDELAERRRRRQVVAA